MVDSEGQVQGAPPGAWRLLQILRDRWTIVALTIAAALLGALIYVSAAGTTYQAEADLLVSAESDPNLNVLPLFRTSSDPTQDTQTAALLVHTAAAAAAAARTLGLKDSPQAILGRVTVDPIAGSDLVAVTATDSTPKRASALADAFARGAVDDLTAHLQAAIQQAIPRLQAQVAQSASAQAGTAPDSAVSQLSAIRALAGGPDPTIRLANTAATPTSPASPRRGLSLAAAGLIGLVVGIGIAFGVDALDPRLRRESQLQQMVDLPILGRVPWVAGRWGAEPNGEGVRALLSAQELLAERLAVSGAGRAGRRAVIFTAPHTGAGCTTMAVHHAWLLAAGGERVVLADGDPRRPSAGQTTGAPPAPELERVLTHDEPIEEALVPVEAGGVTLRVLAIPADADRARVELLGRRQFLSQLLALSDVVVLDAPPLTESGLALRLALDAETVIIVVRVGHTRLAEVRTLGALLEMHGLSAAGVIVVGGPSRAGGRGRPILELWAARVSRRAVPGQNGQGARNDQQVEPQGPIGGVEQVEPESFLIPDS